MTESVVNSIPTSIAHGRLAVPRSARHPRPTLPLLYLYLVWFVLVTDAHRWIAERGLRITAMHQAMSVMMIPLLIMLIVRLPATVGRRGRVIWHMPLLLFLLAAMVSSHLSAMPDKSWSQVKVLLMYYIVFVSAMVFINTPRRAIPVLVLFVGQFWWWGWHSGMTGVVWWHPTYANFDGFGPLVVIGLPVCLFFGLASKSPWLKFGGFFLGGFCALAMVTSFARGVILSGILVAIVAVLRSPRKKRMRIVAALLVGAASFTITSEALHPGGGVWAEVKSAFTEGKDEGTGQDRWELWTKALRVWKAYPVWGVGAEQTGRMAYQMMKDGRMERDGKYGEHPSWMYARALHNVWVQILAEFGIVGSLLVLWILADFWKRNAALRKPESAAQWARVTRGRYNLQLMALGLECGMVAFVFTGLFYNQFYENWFWSLLVLNTLLYTHANPRGMNTRQKGKRLRAKPVRANDRGAGPHSPAANAPVSPLVPGLRGAR